MCSRLIAAVVSASILLLLVPSCQNRSGERPTYTQKRTARVVTAETKSPARTPSLGVLDTFEEILATRVAMNTRDKVFQVINTNLDIDQVEEQIIVFKDTTDPGDLIRLIVADFDDIRNSYIAAWQAQTQANDVRSFSLYLMDLTGDHSKDIVCFGLNNLGEQTLDAFRRSPSQTGIGLNYSKIAEIVSRGSIEVEERERTAAYQLMQKTDESFPILVYTKDPESENPLDLVRTVYHWRYQEGRYQPARPEKLTGARVQEKQLAELFNSGAAGFETFLEGPWYRASTGPEDLIQFDPKQRKLIFYSGETQEVFDWLASSRTIFRSLRIHGANEFIPSITKQLTVSVSALDTIEVQVMGPDGWDGVFRKLSKESQTNLLRQRMARPRIWEAELSGIYRNDAGFEIFFSSPAFTMKEDGREYRGGFVVYKLDTDVLELKIVRPSGLPQETRTYKVVLAEDKTAKITRRTLSLYPAEVTYKGVEVQNTTPIKLHQVVDAPVN